MPVRASQAVSPSYRRKRTRLRAVSGGGGARASHLLAAAVLFLTAEGLGGQELPLEIRPIGRILIDAAAYDDDRGELSSGTELRQARVGLRGSYGDLWSFQIETDFGDAEVRMKDVWLAYDGFSWGRIRVGNMKEPIHMEQETSTRHITFMERALPVALVPDRHLGAEARLGGGPWLLQLGLFGQGVEDVGDAALESAEGWAATGRLGVSPILESDRVIHLGLAASRRTPGAHEGEGPEVRFRARPESHVDRTRSLDTGAIDGVEHHTLLGVEGAAVFGPFSAQGEYVRAAVAREGDDADATFSGSYLFLSWLATGESRSYSTSERDFGGVTPDRESGAVELALRYSTIDLTDADAGIEGGSADNWTLGINWYATSTIRTMANLVFVDHDELADGAGGLEGDHDFTAFQLRFQISF